MYIYICVCVCVCLCVDIDRYVDRSMYIYVREREREWCVYACARMCGHTCVREYVVYVYYHDELFLYFFIQVMALQIAKQFS